MKTGIELIAKERDEQMLKHGRSIEQDVKINDDFQLTSAALCILSKSYDDNDSTGLDSAFADIIPLNWNKKTFQKMYDKPYKERLVIAGALIAAEIDRLQNL